MESLESASGLNIYIKYKFLTVKQHGSLLLYIDTLCKDIHFTLFDYRLYDYEYLDSSFYLERLRMDDVLYPPFIFPLCIQDIHTGNSINIDVGFKKGCLPQFKIKDHHLNILLPIWTAVPIIAGGLLWGGIEFYKNYQEVKLNEIELELKNKEKNRNDNKEQFEKNKYQFDSVKQYIQTFNNRFELERKSPTKESINQTLSGFKKEIYRPNISSVQINGLTINDERNIN